MYSTAREWQEAVRMGTVDALVVCGDSLDGSQKGDRGGFYTSARWTREKIFEWIFLCVRAYY